MEEHMKTRRNSLILSAVMAAVCVLLCLIPDTRLNPYSAIPRAQVRIDAVDNTALYPVGIVYSGVQSCTVTVLSGPQAGSTATAVNYMNSALDKDKLFAPGDTGYAMVQTGADGLHVTLIDHYRAQNELWIFLGLALALIAFGQGAALLALFRRARTSRQTERKLVLLLCTLLWVLPLGYAVLTRATVYNGWRHFYFLYGPMLALAAYGIGVIARRLQKNGLRAAAHVGATLLALCLAMTGTLMALAHPNEYVYYNQLLSQRNVPEYLELDYWNVDRKSVV